jgi:hypothetical protein
MKWFLCAIGFFGLLTIRASAADATGTWKASIDTANGNFEITFNLKAEGDKLTGTVGSRMGEQSITDGKIDGENLAFQVKFNGPNGELLIEYKGKVAGDELKLTSSVQGRDQTYEFTAKRVPK